MNKKKVFKAVWAGLLFVALAVGINNGVAVESGSVWFLSAVLIAHMGITVRSLGSN